jgi:putative ABC transport system ATP-binding protein
MTSSVAIRLDDVARHFATPAGAVRALDGLTVDIERGTSVAVVGPSGCGKSTLLGLIGGLAVPTSGRVVVDGQSLSELDGDARARLRRTTVGFVFQSDNLVPCLSAAENVALQLTLASGGGAPDAIDRALALLGDLGLGDHRDKLPDQLSRGQRQRVAVARALVHRPSVLLADEPTGSLDDESAATLVDLVLAAHRDVGATLVVVTHDATIAAQLDRTLSLRDGRLDMDADIEVTIEHRGEGG